MAFLGKNKLSLAMLAPLFLFSQTFEFCLHLYTIYALQNTFHIVALTGRLREMRKSIHISVPMVMCVCVWTCVELVILRGIIMMSMNNKNRRTVVMSSAGFLVKTGVQEMLVINLKLSLSCFFILT